MASVTGGLNFGYHKDVSKEQTFVTQNYTVDVYEVAGLPTWSFTNPDNDDRWMGTSNMPATSTVILSRNPTLYPDPSPLTLYWGSGAHHRHHGGYQLAQAKMVITVDWANARITFPSGVNAPDNAGQLPWAPNSKGSLMSQLIAHASDPDVTAAVSG